MYEGEGTKNRYEDVQPPDGPYGVQERFPAESVLLVNETDCDVDERGGAHGVRAKK